MEQTNASIRKDIFVAVISNGSMAQKENWKATCEAAAEWVFSTPVPTEDTWVECNAEEALSIPKKVRKRKSRNAEKPSKKQ